MSLTGKSPSETYKDIAYVDNSNNGVTTSLKQVKTGSGSSTALQVSDRALLVKSSTNNTTALDVQNASGASKLLVDTTNNYVKANGVHVHTMYKEFGTFDHSPAAGYHYPLVANNMMFSDSGTDWGVMVGFGNGTDPATSLDVSAHTSYPLNTTGAMWYIMDAITIDQIRVTAMCNSSENLNFHVFSYDLDTSSNHGDLSGGTLIAHIGSVMAASTTTIKTDTLAIDSADIAANKVLIAFYENEDGTGDVTCQLNIKYHITG